MTAGEEDIGQALARYAREAAPGDLMLSAQGDPAMAHRWEAMFGAIASAARGGFAGLQERADQQVVDLGMAFRLTGEVEERVWPLSPVPMLIHTTQWQGIEEGLAQRADLLERVLDTAASLRAGSCRRRSSPARRITGGRCAACRRHAGIACNFTRSIWRAGRMANGGCWPIMSARPSARAMRWKTALP